jgi:pantothenate kinase
MLLIVQVSAISSQKMASTTIRYISSRTYMFARHNSTYSFDQHVLHSIHKGGLARSYTGQVTLPHLNTQQSATARYENIPRAKGAPFIVGVAGGTASGKTEVVKQIVELVPSVAVIPQDSFYKDLTDSEKLLANKSQFNFDHPFAFDFSQLRKLLTSLRQGAQEIRVPTYDYVNHGVFPSSHDVIIHVSACVSKTIFV